MEKFKKVFAHVLKILKWAFLILVGVFIILVIARIPHALNQQKTDAQIIKIHNTKLTLPDVMGENLPPYPGVEADKTVQGIDANNNGIRDDVELAIFKEYPNSAKTRAVLLQYALTLQMEVMQPIINTSTATEVAREQSRAYVCIGDVLSRENLEKFNKEADTFTNFVKERMFNTEERKNNRSIFVDNVRSYSNLEQKCDIDLFILSN
ncbi:MAG: hypothetical protein NTV03_01905 [Candidatus Nomurabacteria bacterium]|nr:hypothetical protein [Candidatus Nomurabacteria bacterium]